MSVQPFTTPLIPEPPDFHICDGDTYGKRLNRRNCLQVANLLPDGNAPEVYFMRGQGPFGIPWQQQRGNCRITVDVAGPGVSATNSMRARPDNLRGITFGLIQQCVKNRGGVGGFITFGLHYITDYLTLPSTNIYDTLTWLSATSYFTITVDGGGEYKKPGDNSPYIPATIARLMSDKSAQGGPNQGHYGAAADYFLNKANEVRDGHVPWWCYNCGFGDYHGQGQQHMAYECDASLGAPSPVDCSQLDYSQLGIPSDTVTIGPGAPKVLVSNTCDVEISSDKTVTLRWSDVRSALETLIDLCVSNPLGPSIGGRTYYSSKPLIAKSLVRRDDNYAINFLVPGVNLTVYQPGHHAS